MTNIFVIYSKLLFYIKVVHFCVALFHSLFTNTFIFETTRNVQTPLSPKLEVSIFLLFTDFILDVIGYFACRNYTFKLEPQCCICS